MIPDLQLVGIEDLYLRHEQHELYISLNLLEVLNAVHTNPYQFDQVDFDQFELRDLLRYLTGGHLCYIHYWLPKINQTFSGIQPVCKADSAAVMVIKAFLNKYQEELERHIEHEEAVLFGFCRRLLQGTYHSREKDMVLQHFLFTHNDDVILELDDLKKWITENSQQLAGDLAFRVLFTQLELFQNDLLVHGRIEDEVFMPRLLAHINSHFETLEGL